MGQIHLRISDELKTEWDAHADESAEYGSLSDIIRRSVTREVRGVEGNGPGSAFDMPPVENRLNAVEDALSGLRDDVDRNHSAIIEVREHAHGARARRH